MALFTGVAAAFTAFGTWFAAQGVLMQFAIRIGIALGANLLANALAGKPKVDVPGIVGEVQLGADLPRSFILGRYATRGSLVYHQEHGKAGDTPNAYYTRVTALSDLPVKGLAGIWVDGERCTIDLANPDPGGKGFPILEFHSGDPLEIVVRDGLTGLIKAGQRGGIGSGAWVKFYDGTQTAADGFLVGLSTEERPWTTAEVGRGVAYAVTTFRMDREKFQGFPDCLFEIDGVQIENPADGTTGTADENPIAQAHAILSGMGYAGKWLYGPQGAGAGRMRADEWGAQANACNEPVPGADTMTDAQKLEAFGSLTIPPRYRSGYEVRTDQEIAKTLETILSACNGRVAEVGTHYRVTIGDPRAPVLHLTDDDLLSTEAQTFVPFFGLAESINGVTATYPAPAEGWAIQDAPPVYVAAYEAQDGNRRLLTNVPLQSVPFKEQVQRLLWSALNEARRARRHTLALPPEFVVLEPLDYITWTSPENGYDGKLFRVDGVTPAEAGNVVLDITEVDPADYDYDAATQYVPPVGGSVDPQARPALLPVGWGVFADAVADGNGEMRRPALRLEWDGTPAGVTALAWQVRVMSTGGIVATGTAQDALAGMLLLSEGVLPAITYEARGRYVAGDVPTAWGPWEAATTSDLRLQPADLNDVLQDELAKAEQTAAKADQLRADHDALTQDFVGRLTDAFARSADDVFDTALVLARDNISEGISSVKSSGNGRFQNGWTGWFTVPGVTTAILGEADIKAGEFAGDDTGTLYQGGVKIDVLGHLTAGIRKISGG